MTEHLPSMSCPPSVPQKSSVPWWHTPLTGALGKLQQYWASVPTETLKYSKWYTINISPIYIKQPVVLSEFIKTYLLLLSKLKPAHSLHRDSFMLGIPPAEAAFLENLILENQFPYFERQPWISLYQN